MNTDNFTSACRYCRHYNPEGRRGGTCQRLGVTVQARWKACALASPPFSDWQSIEEIVQLESCLSLKSHEVIAEAATTQTNLVSP